MRHAADFNLFTRDPTCQTGKLIVNGTNGIGVEADNEEVASVGLAVASGTMKYEALLDWVRKHIG